MVKKQTIHFIYTVPRGGIILRVINKIIQKIKIIPPLHRYGVDFFIPWRRPIRAPHSISFNLLQELKKNFRVKFYSLYEHTVCNVKEGDVVLAQPAPIINTNPPESIDTESVTYRTFYKYPNAKKVIIMPYSHDAVYTAWWKKIVEDHGQNSILISGRPWFDTWDKSPFSHIKFNNLMRMDMGIDLYDYPNIKRFYNPKGMRGILYVGHTSWYKNVQQLEQISKRFPKYRFGHIGRGSIEGWEKIEEFADLTPEFMSEIAKDFDIFINCSNGDPQVTTVLECMAFGFIVACTPESGYSYPSLIRLDKNSVDFNCAQIEMMQFMDDSEIIKRVRDNRNILKKKHDWKRVRSDVVGFINVIK